MSRTTASKRHTTDDHGPARKFRRGGDTRTAILNAAEKRLISDGPEGIRLQDIAADLGISHPAILHHFGSRERLVEALVAHGMAGLQEEFLAGWPSRKVPDIEGVMERFFRLAEKRGMARLMAWLVLSGRDLGATRPGGLTLAVQRMHGGRVRAAEKAGRPAPDFENTLFAAVLLSIMVLGDALFGTMVRGSVGLGSGPAVTRRFRKWLVKVCESLERGGRARISKERREADEALPQALPTGVERNLE